jgi:hypothetical protein
MTASEHEFECCNNHLMQKAESKIKIHSSGGELEGGGGMRLQMLEFVV